MLGEDTRATATRLIAHGDGLKLNPLLRGLLGGASVFRKNGNKVFMST